MDVLRLYGVKISMFTGKARSYLIKQHIPFEEVSAADPHYMRDIIPVIGRRIIPVIEMPGGKLVQDTTDIIDHLEVQGLARQSAYPEDPFLRLVSLILELFGDEGLMRPAMHYRWNFDDRTDGFIRHGFVAPLGPNPRDTHLEMTRRTMEKMQSYLPPLGIFPQTIPEIERAYGELLDCLEVHFKYHPYLLGGAPSIGDYGMMCSLYAHLGRDPVPAGLMKNRAPSLYRWTERMNMPHDDMSELPNYQNPDKLPETLSPLLEYIGKYFVPETKAIFESFEKFLQSSGPFETGKPVFEDATARAFGMTKFKHGDVDFPAIVRPMRFYMMQRVTDCFTAMSDAERKQALNSLSPFGLAPLLTLTASRRIARQDHREVWGETVT